MHFAQNIRNTGKRPKKFSFSKITTKKLLFHFLTFCIKNFVIIVYIIRNTQKTIFSYFTPKIVLKKCIFLEVLEKRYKIEKDENEILWNSSKCTFCFGSFSVCGILKKLIFGKAAAILLIINFYCKQCGIFKHLFFFVKERKTEKMCGTKPKTFYLCTKNTYMYSSFTKKKFYAFLTIRVQSGCDLASEILQINFANEFFKHPFVINT